MEKNSYGIYSEKKSVLAKSDMDKAIEMWP